MKEKEDSIHLLDDNNYGKIKITSTTQLNTIKLESKKRNFIFEMDEVLILLIFLIVE